MTRARDVSRLVTTPPNIYATDTETSSAGYLTNASASTIYSTISSNKVVQIKTASVSGTTSSTSTSYVDTNLTVSITPTSASNKILVGLFQLTQKNAGNNYSGVSLRLLRNATAILTIGTGIGFTETSVNNRTTTGCFYLDEPATTSATTYKTQFASGVSGNVAYVNTDGASTILVMEVTP
jgi:hypothetical protein